MKQIKHFGKPVTALLVFLFSLVTTTFSQTGGNYVVTNTIQKQGITSTSQLAALPAEDLKKEIVYVDGFGRPIQKVDVQASPTKKDVISITEYDAFNRNLRLYLPFSITGTGAYRPNAKTELNAFYGANATANKVATTAYPYAERRYEASPQDKILEEGQAGEAWQLSTGRTSKTLSRPCEANEVRVWNYNFTDGSISSPGFYAAGDVLAEEERDEHGVVTISYTDKRGQLVMKNRRISASDSAVTYNVFDAFGNRRATLQPEGVKELQQTNTWTLSAAFIDKWCFTFRYDEWQRVIDKKAPGSQAEYLVYNKKGQTVLTQDGELRKTNKWFFTKFDGLGRKVLSGIYTHSAALTQAQMQQLATADAGFEVRTAQNYSTQHGYTVTQSFPQLATTNSEILAIEYYDDYDNDRFSVTPGTTFIPLERAIEPVPSYRNHGMATASRHKVLGESRYVTSTTIYDENNRAIQTIAENIFNRVDVTTMRLDFLGVVQEKVTYHGGPSDEIYIKQQFNYDHRKRLKKSTIQVERDEQVFATVTLAEMNYNELGQVIEKKLHSTDGATYLQNVDFAYNIRGWLTRINDASLTDPNDLFGLEIKYNEGLLSPFNVAARFDGNISEIWWKDGISNKKQGYAYQYDIMGRMLSAQYVAAGAGGWTENGGFDESATYDHNGNIKTLSRYQWSAGVRQLADQLTYTYAGNVLKKVEDNATVASGFINGAIATDEYTYDANGHLLTDMNKGITSIVTNVFSRPAEILLGTRGKIVYKYDASGKKHARQVVLPTGTTTNIQYANGFEYLNGVLQHMVTEEGRVLFTGTTPSYEYTLEDHLGNARVNFDRNPVTGKARIIQKTDYYPYGMALPGAYVSGLESKYKYTGKEFQDELGLDWYDYGIRSYDAQIARWHSIDPATEKMPRWSPYAYAYSNPVRFVDPDGMEPSGMNDWENQDDFDKKSPDVEEKRRQKQKKEKEAKSGVDDAGSEEADQQQGWQYLDKTTLVDYLRRTFPNLGGGQGTLQNFTGNVFEDAWHRSARASGLMAGIRYRQNTVRFGQTRTTVPDGIGDVWVTGPMGTGLTGWRFQDAAWFEVKAMNGHIYESTSSHQIGAHIDNLVATLPPRYRGGVMGKPAAALVFVTTSNVNVGARLQLKAATSNVALHQYKAQYRIQPNGVMQVRFHGTSLGRAPLVGPRYTRPVDLH